MAGPGRSGPKKRDLIGQVFGRWCVVAEASGYSRWLCACSCGKQKVVYGGVLVNGTSRSCGCLLRELNQQRTKHGEGHGEGTTPEYWAWTSMKQRCLNPNSHVYRLYGGCGITICERWLGPEGFQNFLEDMGRRPGSEYSLDRFPDPYGNYEKSNCRWATPSQQSNNKRKFENGVPCRISQ